MSDLLDASNNALKSCGDAFQTIGGVASALKTAGDELGPFGSFLNFISDIISLFNDANTKLQDLLQELQKEVAEERIDLNFISIFTRQDSIDNAMGPARGVWEQLQLDTQNHVIGPGIPVTQEQEYYARGQISQCLGSLKTFVPSSIFNDPAVNLYPDHPADTSPAAKWFAVRDAQKPIYFSTYTDQSGAKQFGATFNYVFADDRWRDHSLGPMKFSGVLVPGPAENIYPGLVSGGFVFCPIYTLTAYLEALAIFVTVGSARLPTFAEEYKGEIEQHAKFLRDLYNKILTEGYVFLPMPPNPWVADWGPLTGGDPDPSQFRYLWNEGSAYTPGTPYHGGWADQRTSDFGPRPFGCVDRFTGDYVLGSFPDVVSRFPADRFNTPAMLTMVYQALLIEALRCGKQLYQKQNLDAVHSAANTLWQLAGNTTPLLPGPSFGDWSMKEVFQVISNPGAALTQNDHPERLVGYYTPDKYGDPWGLRGLLSQLGDSCFTNPTPDNRRSIRTMLSSQ